MNTFNIVESFEAFDEFMIVPSMEINGIKMANKVWLCSSFAYNNCIIIIWFEFEFWWCFIWFFVSIFISAYWVMRHVLIRDWGIILSPKFFNKKKIHIVNGDWYFFGFPRGRRIFSYWISRYKNLNLGSEITSFVIVLFLARLTTWRWKLRDHPTSFSKNYTYIFMMIKIRTLFFYHYKKKQKKRTKETIV